MTWLIYTGQIKVLIDWVDEQAEPCLCHSHRFKEGFLLLRLNFEQKKSENL